jgi:hypothetical protein
MAGLYNDSDALQLEHFGEGKADLLCELFLDLKSLQEHFDYSSNLREANYSAVGDVSNVHLALLACNRLGHRVANHTFLENGTRWCSQSEKNLMSFTITISS